MEDVFMDLLPEEVLQAWKNRTGAVIFTTVAPDGTPNSVYITCVELYQNSRIVIADNYFCKTRENIRSGSTGAVLFITDTGKAYQIKGEIEHHETGESFDFMKEWNPKQHPGHAAVVIVPREVYFGAKELK
jgi:hypothetical protein